MTTTKRRRRWPRILKWLRRIHLYLGIALSPWVLLYGVTAILFNHSSWFTETTLYPIDGRELESVPALQLSNADVISSKAFLKLATLAQEDDIELKRVPVPSRWVGSVSLSARSPGQRLRGRLDADGRGGRLRIFKSDSKGEYQSWCDVEELEEWQEITAEQKEAMNAAALELIRGRGLAFDKVSVQRMPAVRFHVSANDEEYACDIKLDGSCNVRPTSELSTLRERLLRLHLQHGDPGHSGVKRYWALIVDVVGIAMIVWAVTGVLMWWAIKSTRWTGLGALLAGVVSFGAMAAALWQASGAS